MLGLKPLSTSKGNPEPDAELRDAETVPLTEEIKEYFKREVLAHVPDAWIDEKKTKIGYEIPLNRSIGISMFMSLRENWRRG